jgi:energy-coupling factor transport system ATP-binding protein
VPEPGAQVLRILVAAETGDDGPCVRTPGEFEISIASRGITALIGANGAGKSVLLRCATGLSTCPQVRLEMSGRWDRPPLMVSQYPEREIFEDTVSREIAYAATRRGLSRVEANARAIRELSRFGFDGERFLMRRTWELSAGEKRVVLLVAGVIAPAGLLALDEPTAGLDPGRRAALERAVLERAEIGPVLVAGQDREWLGGLGVVPRSVPPGPNVPSPSKKTD